MTLVIAHRGASKDHEENTISAFEGAKIQGADWIELDVRATSDDVLVIHHDAAFKDGRNVNDVMFSDLPPSVPTLRAVFDVCDGMGVNVEIKNAPGEPGYDDSGKLVDAVIAEIRSFGSQSDVLVTCFDLETLNRCRRSAPEIATGYLVLSINEPSDAVAAALTNGHIAVNPLADFVTQADVDRAHEAGIALNTWTTDDPERIAELASFGVDGIITNVPAIARAALVQSD